MVIGMIKDAMRYQALSSRIAEALQWLQTADMAALQEGTNPIRGEEIFCNVNAYQTTVKEARVWEGHRKYYDFRIGKDCSFPSRDHACQTRLQCTNRFY
mgnify:CR=1 FL=1